MLAVVAKTCGMADLLLERCGASNDDLLQGIASTLLITQQQGRFQTLVHLVRKVPVYGFPPVMFHPMQTVPNDEPRARRTDRGTGG